MPTASPFTSTRIKALADRITVASRQQLVETTKEKVAANQAAIRTALGQEAPIHQYVDGSPNRPVDDAQLVTLTEFDLLGHVVDAAFQMLIERSPVGPDEGGHYRDDHWLFVNGQRRDATTEGAVVDISPADEVVIINMRKYARKIEGGFRFAKGNAGGRLLKGTGSEGHEKTRRPGLSVQAPDGVYEISAKDLQRRFGNIAKITFGDRGALGAVVKTRENRFPCLVITAKAS